MISKQAAQQFLDRELDSFDWVKRMTEKELDYELSRLSPRPQFTTVPRKHQKVCFLIGALLPEFLYFCDLGTGKTKIALDLVNYHLRGGARGRALVVVPNVTNMYGWENEARIHTPGLRVQSWGGGSKRRWEEIRKPKSHVYVINYAGLVSMVCKRVVMPGKKGKLVVDSEKLDHLCKMFAMIIPDESQAIKSWSSLSFQVVNAIGEHCRTRYALTGTPFGRDPQDFWAQFRMVDHGKTLGPNLGLFRHTFFNSKRKWHGGFVYTVKAKREKKLYEVLKNRSISYMADECDDLPELTQIPVCVAMPEEYRPYYEQVIKIVRESKGNYTLNENAFMNLRQLTSGFLNIKNEFGDKDRIVFGENPKLEALLDLVDALPVGRKMVVFHEFIFVGDMIRTELTKRKIGTARLGGDERDPAGALKAFDHDESCRVFIVNSKSGAAGLNLQRANYQVFFESPVSAIVRRQAEKRCYRSGQKERVFMYDLIMRPGLDEKILEYIRGAKDLFAALVTGKESWS